MPISTIGTDGLSTSPTLTTPKATTTIGVGNATPSASGAGITFPAAINASSDANTLDDYEEGGWTPVMASASGSITTQSSSGTYVKVGKVVTVYYRVTLTTVGTASGSMLVTGLPFSATNSGGSAMIGTNIARENASTGVTYQASVGPNATQIALFTLSTNTNPPWTNGYVYTGSMTYETA